MFWKRKQKSPEVLSDEEPLAEDRLERSAPPPEQQERGDAPSSDDALSTQAPAAKASAAEQAASPLSEPALAAAPHNAVPNPLTPPAAARSETQRGRRSPLRTPQQRLIEDPVRIYGEVVTLMGRDPVYAARSLADLRWIIRPGILSRQVLVARTRPAEQAAPEKISTIPNGGPIAFVAWANVSDEIDRALREGAGSLDAMRPHSEAWRSGSNLWIVALSGPDAVRGQLIKHLQDKAPTGREIGQLSP